MGTILLLFDRAYIPEKKGEDKLFISAANRRIFMVRRGKVIEEKGGYEGS